MKYTVALAIAALAVSTQAAYDKHEPKEKESSLREFSYEVELLK